mgnify:CR=1 FL=1
MIAIAIVFGLLLVTAIVLPFALKGRIMERVERELAEQVDARVELGGFSISLIRQFPNVSLRLEDFRVIGNEPFEGDTLADVGRFYMSLNLRTILRGDYEVSRVRLDDATFLFKLLEDGRANWNIFPALLPDDEEVADADIPDVADVVIPDDEPSTEEAASDFSIALKQLEVRRGRVVYHDDKWVTYIDAKNINGVFAGDLGMAMTTLATRDATIGEFSLRWDVWPILSKARVKLTAEMDADLDRFVFWFRDNELLVNELPLVFEGMVGWPVDDLEMDFRFGAARSDFAAFLSLLPALYTADFRDLESSGTLQLEGHVKGAMTADAWPGFGLTLAVSNGMFRYPGLPASVSGVDVSARISNPGPDLDLTVVDVPSFSMNLGGSPVEANFRLATPVSDPQVRASIVGRLDLGRIGEFYPLDEGMAIGGLLDSDLELSGRLSSLESGNYDAFHAEGHFVARDVVFSSADFSQGFAMPVADLRLNPRMVRVEAFEARIGDSDLAASGQIDNILGYLFDGQLLKGSFDTRSAFLDLNQLAGLMPGSEAAAVSDDETDTGAETGDTAALAEESGMEMIPIPANLDFTLNALADRVVYGKMDLRNVSGRVRLAEEKASMESLRMNMLGGVLEINGLYDTSGELPKVDFGLNITGFDIRETFLTFNTARILAPVGEFARGGFSVNLQLSTLLDAGLNPVLESLVGGGRLQSSAVMLANTPTMNALADNLKINELREMSLRNILLSFSFADGKVELPPVDLRFGDVRANVSGVTYFDQRLSYTMNFEIPRALFGTQANQVLEGLVSEAAGLGVRFSPGEVVPVDVLVGGTFRRPELSVSLAALRGRMEQQLRDEADRLLRETEDRLRQEADQARQQLQEEVEERVEAVRERVGEEVESRVAQVMEAAERQAANIRRAASNTAESVRKEAREQAARLEREAQGPIAQAAARRTAQVLISEADRRAGQIEAEGERNAQRVMEEAREQAARIRRGEE